MLEIVQLSIEACAREAWGGRVHDWRTPPNAYARARTTSRVKNLREENSPSPNSHFNVCLQPWAAY